MDEGRQKTVPLRRSRPNGRGVAVGQRSWTQPLGVGIQSVLGPVLGPPRQLWLAGLGSGALTLRGARSAWALLVAEGSEVESRLRSVVSAATGR